MSVSHPLPLTDCSEFDILKQEQEKMRESKDGDQSDSTPADGRQSRSLSPSLVHVLQYPSPSLLLFLCLYICLPSDQELEDLSSVASLALLSGPERKVQYTCRIMHTNHSLNTMYTSALRGTLIALVTLLARSLQLCQSVRVQPEEYISLKADILKSSALKHSGYPGKLKLPRHLSSEQRSKIMSYFSTNGWTS